MICTSTGADSGLSFNATYDPHKRHDLHLHAQGGDP
jgi:hypothetical protein